MALVLRSADPDLRHELEKKEMVLVTEVSPRRYPELPARVFLVNEEIAPKLRQQVSSLILG